MVGPSGAWSHALCKLTRLVTVLSRNATCVGERLLEEVEYFETNCSFRRTVGWKANSLTSASAFPGKAPKSIWASSDMSWEEGSDRSLGNATWWRAYSVLQILSMLNKFFQVCVSSTTPITVINQLEKYLMFDWLNQEGPNANVWATESRSVWAAAWLWRRQGTALCTFNHCLEHHKMHSSFAVLTYGVTIMFFSANCFVERLSIHAKSSHWQYHVSVHTVYLQMPQFDFRTTSFFHKIPYLSSEGRCSSFDGLETIMFCFLI